MVMATAMAIAMHYMIITAAVAGITVRITIILTGAGIGH